MTNAAADTTAVHPQSVPSGGKTGILTRIAYGFGSVAYGIKDGGFNYFLVLFYSQVIGIQAWLASSAIFVALVIDAISDPIVGYWSDNLKSRWGRRHPFIYAAALPVSLSYFLLWSPPIHWPEWAIFLYLLVLAVSIRTFITLFETPSSALGFELSTDYQERSSLIGMRYFFAWFGGNFMSVFMFLFLFGAMATASIPDGRFNPDSYRIYGYLASALMLVSVLVSGLGTHHKIKSLSKAAEETPSIKTMLLEIKHAFNERSFIALFCAAVFGAVATGLTSALSFIFYIYFWGFTSPQIGLMLLSVFGSAIIGSTLAPIAVRLVGKKHAAMGIGIVASLGYPMPIILRLAGILPENGDPLVFWFVMLTVMIDVGLIIAFQILTTSMMADLVEQYEVKSGRRLEGIFAASSTFIRKLVQGLGLMAAAMVLTFAGLQKGAVPSQVAPETVFKLGLYYVPMLLAIWALMMFAVSFYRLTRQDHEENLAELARRKHAGPAPAGD